MAPHSAGASLEGRDIEGKGGRGGRVGKWISTVNLSQTFSPRSAGKDIAGTGNLLGLSLLVLYVSPHLVGRGNEERGDQWGQKFAGGVSSSE